LILTFLPSALDATVSALVRIPSILTEIPIAKTTTIATKITTTKDADIRPVRFRFFDKSMVFSFWVRKCDISLADPPDCENKYFQPWLQSNRICTLPSAVKRIVYRSGAGTMIFSTGLMVDSHCQVLSKTVWRAELRPL
jgi:hypothetical protein